MIELGGEGPRRAVVAAVQLPGVSDEAFESSVSELRQLAKTLGIVVVGTVTQKRSSFDAAAYLGKGKRDELKDAVGWVPPEERVEGEPAEAEPAEGDPPVSRREPLAEMVLVDHEISPSQTRNLEKETGCDVLDRTGVILEIFHRHAHSPAAKAQVEMVRLQYMAPRLRESPRGRDRVRGGVGGKGAGESGLELDRRKIRDRIAELGTELARLEAERRVRRARRSDSSAIARVNRVALVGYTNAGKSTLMRALTGSEVYVADKLFATLDTTVRTLVPESVPRVLVSDTVGFIKNLPHGLVESFKSTLEEALEASLLCHVVDASDPNFRRQLEVTEEVLAEIGAGEVPRLLVFNKLDKVGDDEAQAAREAELAQTWPGCLVLSAMRPGDVERLRAAFLAFFSRGFAEADLLVPYDKQKLRGEIFAACEVVEERYEEDGVVFKARAHPAVIDRLRSLLG